MIDMVNIKVPCRIGATVKVSGDKEDYIGRVVGFQLKGYTNPFDNMEKLPRIYAEVSNGKLYKEIVIACDKETGEFPPFVEIIKEGF